MRRNDGVVSSRCTWQMSRKNVFLLFLAVLASIVGTAAGDGATLDETLMRLSWHSMRLSSASYYEDVDDILSDVKFDSVLSFADEPDRILVAEKDGYCYLAFRGTTIPPTPEDQYQNLKMGYDDVCSNGECCEARSGYYEAFFDVNYFDEMLEALDNCVLSSSSLCVQNNSMDCVVITGHSQGAGVANIAAIYLSHYNPIMIGFATSAALKYPCPLVQQDRWYMFINTITHVEDGLVYDVIPLITLMADLFGHAYLISANSTSVAYLGMSYPNYDVDLSLTSGGYDGVHNNLLYNDNVQALYENGVFPVPSGGFPAGHACNILEECQTGSCWADSVLGYDTCKEKLGSCASCVDHTDCLSGECLWTYQCTNPSTGLVESGCRCYWDSQCESGYCDWYTGLCQF